PLADGSAGVIAGTARDLEMTATYYDTPDLRLTRAGASLRYRTDEGWLVKLPERHATDAAAEGLARREFHFAGGPGAPPEGAIDLVQALVRSERISPVARLRTRRHSIPLFGTDGLPLAELVDDDVTVLEGSQPVDRFREIEIELSAGAPAEAAAPLVQRLCDAGAGTPDPTPKIVRALGPRATTPPDVVTSASRHVSTIPEVVQRAIAVSVAKLLENDPGVRLGEDPEAVHQARVATRRLRSHLRTFRTLLEPEWTASLRDELKWLGGELGAVRDADVLLDRLQHRLDELPAGERKAGERMVEGLAAQRADARDELLRAMRTQRYVALLDRLVDAAHHPRLALRVAGDDDSDADVLRGLVRAPWGHLRRAVHDLPDDPPDPALHEIRIRAKRARYAAEAVEPVFGKKARRFAERITRLQDVLGEHQDAVVAGQWLREAAASSGDLDVAFAGGMLAAIEHRAAQDSRDAWADVWRRASRKKLRSWL
ncbi:MAG TPA: CYTH and CHAD domain-containing protein, partial [Acidimicrobiia bacterium]|nr:CYTH and CHAD domain-containing protein [Acidimicrobiia bacterium]